MFCSIPLCNLVDQHLRNLARKFAHVKFISGAASVCIPNYPDKNVPTLLLYKAGQLLKQWVGPAEVGGHKVTLASELHASFFSAAVVLSWCNWCKSVSCFFEIVHTKFVNFNRYFIIRGFFDI